MNRIITLCIGWCLLNPSYANALPDYKSKPDQHVKALLKKYGKNRVNHTLIVDISAQKMHLYRANRRLKTYTVSTSKFGIGSRSGSQKTPLGIHRIQKKFGSGAKRGTIFKARRNTGRVARIITDTQSSKADYVTTRIMWLQGLQKGLNRGYKIDSFKRYIYIHGTDEEGRLGKPASHGCVRMYNDDVIELFSQVPVGTLVNIIR